MTNYNERLNEILAELLWCDKSKAHLVQHYTHRGTNHRAGANAKQSILDLIDSEAERREREARLKGYNSGWVAASRTLDAKKYRYFAEQLELSANKLRAVESELSKENTNDQL